MTASVDEINATLADMTASIDFLLMFTPKEFDHVKALLNLPDFHVGPLPEDGMNVVLEVLEDGHGHERGEIIRTNRIGSIPMLVRGKAREVTLSEGLRLQAAREA